MEKSKVFVCISGILILVYVSTPHKLSEGSVEWCSLISIGISGSVFVLVFDVRCLCYYILLYIIYYIILYLIHILLSYITIISYTLYILSYTILIISYIILFSSSDLFSSIPSPLLFLPPLLPPYIPLPPLPNPLIPLLFYLSLPLLIQSIRVGTWISLFIFQQYPIFPIPNNLTPHVLSEWMVEV